tara:strand:+ start:61 stop:834 length:774 start_codon:yes stop_codon:yes gene_type:complete
MDEIKNKKLLLENKIDGLCKHRLFTSGRLKSVEDIKVFMEIHIYAVWDFMSILKSLQHHICPSNYPWIPNTYTENGISRLINEIVLAEESDEISKNKYSSHFNLYLQAMCDLNADTYKIKNFINSISNNHYDISKADIPECAKKFVLTTYQLLNKNKLHISAALFTYGRETTLPSMFTNILDSIEPVNKTKNLKLYLKRHIDIDTNRHGPLSIKLFDLSHDGDKSKQLEALDAAIVAINARSQLWDCVLSKINENNI